MGLVIAVSATLNPSGVTPAMGLGIAVPATLNPGGAAPRWFPEAGDRTAAHAPEEPPAGAMAGNAAAAPNVAKPMGCK